MLCAFLLIVMSSVLPASSPSVSRDDVTLALMEQYLIQNGKMASADRDAAVQLVASRSHHSSKLQQALLQASREQPRNRYLQRVVGKLLEREGWARWLHSQGPEALQMQAALVPQPSRGPSAVLQYALQAGRQATRHDIGDFVLAIRAAHHPAAIPFLLDVLTNPANASGKWPDNLGDTWGRARFHAAIGLAELGDGRGMQWLIAQTHPEQLDRSIDVASHRMVPEGSLRRNCQHALADLSGLPPDQAYDEWRHWWSHQTSSFRPRSLVNLHHR